MIKILLIEDDNVIQDSVSFFLAQQGMKVIAESGIKDSEKRLINDVFDIILLDVTLPDGNGFDFFEKIKGRIDIPIIFLTALDEEENIVKGFELGAYDYITKPFHARELLSRIKNVLRHTKKLKEEKISIGNVTINLTTSKVYKNGIELEFTALEYRILVFMFENKGKVISRGQILANIWDSQEKYVNDNTLTVYIKRIREKIEEDSDNPLIIKTMRGMGYKIG